MSVDGHLFFTYLLAIINNATFNISVQIFCADIFSVLLSTYLEVELMGHMVILCLPLEELPGCFPKWLHHFTFSPAVRGSNFSTSSPTFVIIWLFEFSFLVDVKWYIIAVWCAFPIVMNIFHVAYWLICISSSENYLFSSIYSLFSLMNWNETLSYIKLFSNLDLYIGSLFLWSIYHFLAYPVLFRSW